MDTLLYFNLIAVAAFSWYNFKHDTTKQTVVTYSSTVATFMLSIVMTIHHMILMIKRKKTPIENNEYPLSTVQSESDATFTVTRSIVEIPKPTTDQQYQQGTFQGRLIKIRFVVCPTGLLNSEGKIFPSLTLIVIVNKINCGLWYIQHAIVKQPLH